MTDFEDNNPYAAPETTSEWKESQRPLTRTPLASRLSRLGASMIDNVLDVIGAAPGLIWLIVLDEFDFFFGDSLIEPSMMGIVAFMAMITGALAVECYQWFLLTKTGQSIGKKALGIRVVDFESEQLPGFWRIVALRIWIPGGLGQIPTVGGFIKAAGIVMIFRPDGRCLHDHLARTKVVIAE